MAFGIRFLIQKNISEARFKRHLFVWLTLAAVLFSCADSACALDPRKAVMQYVHDAWTTNDGLPQDSINAIVQASDGYIWATTQEGTVRFDGVKFTVFDSREIVDNFVFSLFAAPDGTLWLGDVRGLASYRDGKFTRHYDDKGEFYFSVKNISPDADGNLWLGGNDGAAKNIAGKGVRRFKNGNSVLFYDELPNSHVNQTFSDRRENLWIGTNDGLSVWRNGERRVYQKSDGLSDNLITCFGEDVAGDLWIGTENGLNLFRDGKFTVLRTENGLSDNHIRRIYADRDGILWIATDKGLNRLIDGKIAPVKGIAALENDRIQAIFEDREGSLWIGTHSSGLHRLRDGKFTAFGAPEGLLGDSVNSIYEDARGRILIGTAPGGLNVWANNQFANFSAAEGLRANRIIAIAGARDETVWLGTSDGLFSFKNGAFKNYTTADGLINDNVRAIRETADGAVWIGTNGGLSVFKNGAFSNFFKGAELDTDNVSMIVEDRSGRLWIGGDGGLNYYENGKFTSFRKDELNETNFQNAVEDDEGVLWFATWGKGLMRLKNGEIKFFTSKNGLFDDVSWAVVDDKLGNLWLNSNRGIYRVAKQQLNDFADGKTERFESVVYGTADGMRKRENNAGSPAAMRARDGRLWFATTGGAVVIDPNDIKTNRVPPPVVIEKMIADDVPLELAETSVLLSAKTKNVEFHYAGLSFVAPERVRYQYKLDGFDADWIDAGTRHTAYYTNLPPGEYQFRVIAANDDGVWNENGARISFSVATPFWQTRWFYALAAIVFAAMIYLIFEWRTARERRASRIQAAYARQLIESQERERQRIAVELHDGLGQSLVVIKNRALISLSAPENHERMLAQMTDISEAASAAIVEVRGIAHNLHPYQIDYLGLTTALKTLIKSIAETSEIEINSDIDEIGAAISKQTEINLYRIAQESLTNIVKHAAATKAFVRLKISENALELLIEDDGRGFAENDGERKNGLGLIGIGERAKILNARHEIRSVSGKGTTVQLHLNLPEQKNRIEN